VKIFNSFLIWQLIIICTLIISGALLTLTISEDIKNSSIDRTQTIYSNFILANVDVQFSHDDFQTDDIKYVQKRFDSFFNELQNPEIIGIKVWAEDATILFSNNDNIIGLQFPDNPRFQKSMQREVVTILRDYDSKEKLTTKDVHQVLAVYVPISDENDVYGVIEAYIDPTFLNTSIVDTTRTISIIIGIVILIIIIIIIINFQINRKQIIDPIKEIEILTNEVSKGNFKKSSRNSKSSTNEIQNLTNNINNMIDSMESSRNKLIKAERFSAIGELSARIAHDIRNPLGIIRTSLENIKIKTDDPEYIKKTMIKCDSAISRITHQINEVMDFLKDSPIDLEPIQISNILESLQSNLDIPKGIKMRSPTSDVIVLGDKIKIESLFYNLITNAIQKLHDNGIITIKISEEPENMVKITVEDNGESIPKENIKKIFEPLYTTKQIGTGLGLASCKKIVEQHNGLIYVNNDPVTFTIILPGAN
jgi:signal transduction histidine kinase